jgi:23S rRNA pseudouridine1911/1915/1917 synthase
MGEWIVAGREVGARLDTFLAHADRLGSRGRAAAAVARGKVFLNDVETSRVDAARRLEPGDVVRVWMDRPGSAKRRLGAFRDGGLHVLYEDADLVVLDKPAGLLAVPLDRRHGAPSAYSRVEDHLRSHGKRKPLVVHRIDRDTSGLVVFAKNARARLRLKEQFARREPERAYLAVVHGCPGPATGEWRDRLLWDRRAFVQKPAPAGSRGAVAICRYSVLERFAGASLIEVRLDTGRQNQIRVQASLHGHPLVGERRYVGTAGAPRAPVIAFPRQALHAYRLTFTHPTDGRTLTFEAPLPPDLAALLARLRSRQ